MSFKRGFAKFWKCVGALLLPFIVGGIIIAIYMYNTSDLPHDAREVGMGIMGGSSFLTGLLLMINNITEARRLRGAGYVFFLIFSTISTAVGVLALVFIEPVGFLHFIKFATLPYFLGLICRIYFDNGEGQYYDNYFALTLLPVACGLVFSIICHIVASINMLAGYITTGVLSGFILFVIIFATIRLGIPNGSWGQNEKYNKFLKFMGGLFAPIGMFVKALAEANENNNSSNSSYDSDEREASDAFESAFDNYGYYHFKCYGCEATKMGSTIYLDVVVDNYGNEPRSIIENALSSGVSAAKRATGCSISMRYRIK